MSIPIYIVSRCQEERLHTPRILKEAGVSFVLVLDNKEQAEHARRLGYKDALIAGPVDDLSFKRNWITEFHKKNFSGWYIGFDDNILGFTRIQKKYWKRSRIDEIVSDKSTNWRDVFNKPCHPKEFIELYQELINECKKHDAHYGGCATCENPFFRLNKWSFRRYVKSKAFVMDSEAGIEFKQPVGHDSRATAHAIAKYGKVVVNNFLFYEARWYESGGLGTRKEREVKLQASMEETMKEFPGLVKKAPGGNSALRICLTSDASIDRWRRQHGWLKTGSLL